MRDIVWVGTSLEDLRSFPRSVQRIVGQELNRAQQGVHPVSARPLKGFGGAGVLEIIRDFDGNTYRAVYTVKLADAVYVLHVFQKKSKRGIATPKRELDMIDVRFKMAIAQSERSGR
jgi:phage-related protein